MSYIYNSLYIIISTTLIILWGTPQNNEGSKPIDN